MKLGVSTYSLLPAIEQGKMTVLQVVEWIAAHGGAHVEIVPFGFTLLDNPALTDAIRDTAAHVGIEVSNYSVLANFTQADEEAYEREIVRVMREVDVAHRLGAKRMRHDVAWRKRSADEEGGAAGALWTEDSITIMQFESALPQMAKACQRIADYAAQYGITTSVENHLFLVQASDRVQRLLQTVNRPNYKTTLDTGNFLCVDENPMVGVRKNLPYASMVHLKDFHVRSAVRDPGEGWFRSAYGTHLRGAIFGHGDIDVWSILHHLKTYGYDGYATIEFEGIEDCEMGTRISLENARRIWNEV